jgi:hypothetical protein
VALAFLAVEPALAIVSFVLHPTPFRSQTTNRNRANQRAAFLNHGFTSGLRDVTPLHAATAHIDVSGITLTPPRMWLRSSGLHTI